MNYFKIPVENVSYELFLLYQEIFTYRNYQCYIFHQVTQAFLTLQLEIVHVIKLSLGQCLRFLQT